MNLKIMTFNINNGSDNDDWINELKEIINRENLDMVLLQEIKPEWIKNFFDKNFPAWKTFFSLDKCNTILVKNNCNAEQIGSCELKNVVFIYEKKTIYYLVLYIQHIMMIIKNGKNWQLLKTLLKLTNQKE